MGDAYEHLAERLATLGMGMPTRPELLDILRRVLTSEEAAVAAALPTAVAPLTSASPAEVAAQTGLATEEVTATLERLAARGLVYSTADGTGGHGYGLHQTGFGFPQTFLWKGETTPEAAEMAGLVAKYFNREVTREAYASSTTKPYRYVPVDTALSADQQAVYPIHLMEPILAQAERFAVAHCACRMAMHLRGRACDHPLEVCLKFDDLAEYVIERGLGRELSRDEARAVVEQAERAGLVHFVDNAQDKVKHNCNCCGCACWNVGNIRRRKIPRDVLMATYFLRTTDADGCDGCGACVDVCPVQAVALVDDQAVVDEQWCIGCGLCVPRCRQGAAALEPRVDVAPGAVTPDFATLHRRILAEKGLG